MTNYKFKGNVYSPFKIWDDDEVWDDDDVLNEKNMYGDLMWLVEEIRYDDIPF
jgi:hypothetical protein